MKSYEETANDVLKRRDEYRKERARQARIVRGVSLSALCLCLSSVIVIGGWTAINQKNDGHGNLPDLPPVNETEMPETDGYHNTDEIDTPDTSKIPTADPVIDTTPGHDVGNLPTEIPDDVTIIHIPNSSGSLADICIPVTTEYLLENANIVVIGEFLGTDSTTVTETMLFISEGRVKVAEVIKGEADSDDTLPISFYGGTVPVAQIVESVSPARLEKYGWLNMTKEEQQTFLITYSSSVDHADLKEGETYLFFLGDNEYGNFVMCGGLGAREVNEEGKVYNPDTRLYDDIPVIAKYSSLDEAKNNEMYGRYLPEYIPDGYLAESIKYIKSGGQLYLSGLWSCGYNDISWKISDADDYSDSRRTSAEDTVNYDLSLYPIPRAETVPDELREIVDDPVFDAEEVTLEVIYRRAYKVNDAGDTDGYRINFSIQIGDVIIDLRTKGITPEELYSMLGDLIE